MWQLVILKIWDLLGVYILNKRKTKKQYTRRGYNLEQTRLREDVRRVNSRLKSLYDKFGYDYGYKDEISRLKGFGDFDKYIDTSKGYIQILPPTDKNGRVNYRQADETFKHLMNISRKINSSRDWLRKVSKEMNIKYTELSDDEIFKVVTEKYDQIKNQLAPRKEMVYDVLTQNEFTQRFGHLGNVKGQRRKTYAELQPFFDAINGFMKKVEQSGEIPPI